MAQGARGLEKASHNSRARGLRDCEPAATELTETSWTRGAACCTSLRSGARTLADDILKFSEDGDAKPNNFLEFFEDGILKVASSSLAKRLKWTETLVAPQTTLLLSALMTLHAMETTTCELITREFDTKDAVRAVRRAHAGAAELPVVLRLLRCTSGS